MTTGSSSSKYSNPTDFYDALFQAFEGGGISGTNAALIASGKSLEAREGGRGATANNLLTMSDAHKALAKQQIQQQQKVEQQQKQADSQKGCADVLNKIVGVLITAVAAIATVASLGTLSAPCAALAVVGVGFAIASTVVSFTDPNNKVLQYALLGVGFLFDAPAMLGTMMPKFAGKLVDGLAAVAKDPAALTRGLKNLVETTAGREKILEALDECTSALAKLDKEGKLSAKQHKYLNALESIKSQIKEKAGQEAEKTATTAATTATAERSVVNTSDKVAEARDAEENATAIKKEIAAQGAISFEKGIKRAKKQAADRNGHTVAGSGVKPPKTLLQKFGSGLEKAWGYFPPVALGRWVDKQYLIRDAESFIKNLDPILNNKATVKHFTAIGKEVGGFTAKANANRVLRLAPTTPTETWFGTVTSRIPKHFFRISLHGNLFNGTLPSSLKFCKTQFMSFIKKPFGEKWVVFLAAQDKKQWIYALFDAVYIAPTTGEAIVNILYNKTLLYLNDLKYALRITTANLRHVTELTKMTTKNLSDESTAIAEGDVANTKMLTTDWKSKNIQARDLYVK